MIPLTIPQAEFVSSEEKFPAFVGGYGSGKTEGAVWRTLRMKKESPKLNVAYYLPTYSLIEDIAFPRFEETLTKAGIGYTLNTTKKFIEIKRFGKIIFRSMDRPEKIIGYEVADSMIDELDTLPLAKASDVWRKILARNRKKKANGKPNTIGVVTTPEGFKFVYLKWKQRPLKGSTIIQAPTWSNPFLPDDYIENLEDSYSEALLKAYIEGEFVNLNSTSVYSEFDRERHSSNEKIEANETLHIGMDFNVGKMAGIVHVLRDNVPHAVKEHVDLLDTPAMIEHLKKIYWPDGKKNHDIIVYPDASGANRKSNSASDSDIALLKKAGFKVFVNNKNPRVKDRVLSVNSMFKKNEYYVSIDGCPQYVENLEKQAYDKHNEPDKTAGHDHTNDAGGYFIVYRYPIRRGKTGKMKIKGF